MKKIVFLSFAISQDPKKDLKICILTTLSLRMKISEEHFYFIFFTYIINHMKKIVFLSFAMSQDPKKDLKIYILATLSLRMKISGNIFILYFSHVWSIILRERNSLFIFSQVSRPKIGPENFWARSLKSMVLGVSMG